VHEISSPYDSKAPVAAALGLLKEKAGNKACLFCSYDLLISY
jgi:hypothetical protein